MSFTLILNSDNGTKVGNSTNSVGFVFNWNVLEDNSKYELTSSFTSQSYAATASSQFYIRLNGIGGLVRTYYVTNGSVALTSNFIGTVSPITVGANYFLNSRSQDNPRIIMEHKPTGSNFNVEIYNLDGVTQPGIEMKWSLTLHFRKLIE
jgi:hypothetical protein